MHPREEAFVATRTGGLIGMACDERDARVAERNELARHFTGSCKIVDADSGELRRGMSRGHDDTRNALREHGL